MKSNILFFCFLLLFTNTAFCCPNPKYLLEIVVGNNQKNYQRISFSNDKIWNITYTYSIYGLSSDWGMMGDPNTLEPEQKPEIYLENATEWTRWNWSDQKNVHTVYHKTCNYSVLKPSIWAPSPDGKSIFWKFSLTREKVLAPLSPS